MVAAYRSTAAAGGNILANTTFVPANTPANSRWLTPAFNALLSDRISNWRPADGGAGQEALQNAIGRAVAEQYAPERLLDLLDLLCGHCLFVDPPDFVLRRGGFTQAWEESQREALAQERRLKRARAERKKIERESARRRERS